MNSSAMKDTAAAAPETASTCCGWRAAYGQRVRAGATPAAAACARCIPPGGARARALPAAPRVLPCGRPWGAAIGAGCTARCTARRAAGPPRMWAHVHGPRRAPCAG